MPLMDLTRLRGRTAFDPHKHTCAVGHTNCRALANCMCPLVWKLGISMGSLLPNGFVSTISDYFRKKLEMSKIIPSFKKDLSDNEFFELYIVQKTLVLLFNQESLTYLPFF